MPSLSSIRVGAILAVTGLLGLGILLTDQILRTATDHFYALILFVIVDFVLSGLVVAKPSRAAFRLAAVWCALRIVLQLGDISSPTVPIDLCSVCRLPLQPSQLRLK